MSGFEIVGVVLGAIPLIIHAIENYKTTSQRLKFFRFKEPFIAELVRSLEEQKFFIETDLEVVLRAADLEEEEITQLLACSNSSLFQDSDVIQAIQSYLGDGYHPYVVAIARCQRILAEIASNLRGLASDSKQNELPALIKAYPSKNGSYEFTRKIKFTLDKENLDRRIGDLKDSTETLRHLREYSVLKTEVTLRSTSRTINKLTSTLNNIREHAQRLYSAISQGYADQCHSEHETYLFLHSRSAMVDKKKTKSLRKDPAVFKLGFPIHKPFACDFTPCIKSDVEVLEDSEPHENAKEDTVSQVRRTVVINLPNPSIVGGPQPIDIQDLCGSVANAHKTGRLLSLCLSRKGSLCYYQASLGHKEVICVPQDEPTKIISLNQILQDTATSFASPQKWTVNQRMALSFNVASSLIQLQSTPWLYDPLTSKSVCFTMREDGGLDTLAPEYTEMPKPFLVHKFTGKHGSTEKYGCNAKRSMLELGVILLELWHNRTLNSYAAEVKMELGDTFGSRYNVARHWLDLSAYHVLPFYLDAVTRCIECTFATSLPTVSWEDTVFRKSVGEYVLKPLWENCPVEFR